MLTVGKGVAGFTFDPILGEFFLTHEDVRIPEATQEFAINASNSRFWEPPVRRYVEECLAGKSGPRAKDFNMRWVASLVAETHRILNRGGVFLYPRDRKDPSKPGRLRLLYEANPIGMIIEHVITSYSIHYTKLYDALDLFPGAENEADALVQRVGLHLQHR